MPTGTARQTLPQERGQTEVAPHNNYWANSEISLLEAVHKMRQQQVFEEVGSIFGQRKWYPRNEHYNAALRVMHAKVACIMGRPISPDGSQLSRPNHPVALMLI